MTDIVQRLINHGVTILHRKVMFEKFIIFKKNDVVKLSNKVRACDYDMHQDIMGVVAFVGGITNVMRENNLGIQELIVSDSNKIIINWDSDSLTNTSWFPEKLVRVKEWKNK